LRRRLPAILLIAICVFAFLISNVPFGFCTTETRYFRSDTETVNGLNAYKLRTSQTGIEGSGAEVSGSSTLYYYIGIRVWKRDSSGVETEITGGSPVAVVTVKVGSGGLKSATWNCPQTSLSSTDSIVVRVYHDIAINPPTTLVATFTTEQLSAAQLDSATWTVYYYINARRISGTTYGMSFKWDTTTYNSKITNFSWTSGVTKSWHSITWNFALATMQWNNIIWNFDLTAKQWHIITWTFNLATKQWHSITWIFELLTKSWHHIQWNFILDASTKQWHSITWIFNLPINRMINLNPPEILPSAKFPIWLIGAIIIIILGFIWVFNTKR